MQVLEPGDESIIWHPEPVTCGNCKAVLRVKKHEFESVPTMSYYERGHREGVICCECRHWILLAEHIATHYPSQGA